MVIESDARRFIIQALKIDKELQQIENANTRGEALLNDRDYNAKREELVSQLS